MILAADGRSDPRVRLVHAFQRHGGVLTRGDIRALGVGSKTIGQLLESGKIVRAAHGVYRLADVIPFGTAAFAQACLAIPSGVIALASALAHHELTTQIVSPLQIAVPRSVARKRIEIPLRIVHMELSRFRSQIERVRSPEGDRFRIFDRERTVCDCFAYPTLVAETVAFEGLRTYLDDAHHVDLNALLQQAAFTGTQRFIEPVVKTITA